MEPAPTAMEGREKIVRSAGLVSLLTLVSRITGYLRDLMLAQVLGAAHGSDAFIIAFRIPNLLRRLVGEGALTAAMIPTLSEYKRDDRRREFWEFASLAFTTLAVVVAALAAAGIIFSPLLVKLLAYGFTGIEDKWDLTISLNRLMFPYILFISLAALAMATLNTLGIFGLPASTPILLNLSIIVVAWLFGRTAAQPAYAFAWGVLLGGALQIGIQIPLLWKRGWRPRLRISFSHPGIVQVGRLMLPGIFGMGVTQIALIVDSQFASFLGKGAVSALYYSGRINELALGAFAISVSTVILPALSSHAAAGRIEELRSTVLFGLRIVAFITIPSAVGLVVLRTDVVRLLFERGAFDVVATAATSEALLFYALGLFALGGVRVIAPAFYARKDTRTPVIVAAISLGFHVILCWVLSRNMGLGGIALADSITATLNMTLLILTFRRACGLPLLRTFLIPVAVFLAAAAVMGALCEPVLGWLRSLLAGLPGANAIAVIATLILMAGFYFGLCRLMGREEPASVLSAMTRGRRSHRQSEGGGS
jgi:putative peptidoglycan lipid II flippase